MFSVEKNFFGGHGIVGAPAPLGTGLAFANQYRGNGRVALTFFGEGAANQGQVYESFNMASLWKLPVVYIVENNHYAMGTSVERGTAHGEALHKRGQAFGIPGAQIDGMDVAAVKEAGEKALEHVRSGQGPMILEMITYRYRGHSMSDPAKYRTREEVQEMREQRDPIELVRKRLLDSGRATEDELKEIDREVRARVTEAAEFAQADPEPEARELYTDVTA
jgi:pyruvate dehydrogenase E1 component alpha subunit